MKRNRWLPVWLIPALIVLAIGTVWLRLWIVKTTYAINQADQSIRVLRQQRERVELEVTGLKSPRRLEVLAKSRFNLNQPQTNQVVYIK